MCTGDTITIAGDLFHGPPTESNYRGSNRGPGAILARSIVIDAVGPRDRSLIPSAPPRLEAEHDDGGFGSSAALSAIELVLERIFDGIADLIDDR